MAQKLIPIPPPEEVQLLTRDEFFWHVKEGFYCDDDGSGYYANETGYDRERMARPSDFIRGVVDTSWTHVAWFNK